MENFYVSLVILAQGMGGVFVVSGLIWLGAWVLGKWQK